jgi:DNA-binding NarL/FixJ family response regulator
LGEGGFSPLFHGVMRRRGSTLTGKLLFASLGRGGTEHDLMKAFKTLLVEDNVPFRTLLKEFLTTRFPQMELFEAGDGPEAMGKVDQCHPELIFMDVRLPGENGLELTSRIKDSHPEITVIILTSYDMPEYREAARRYQANYFLSKGSTSNDELFRLVHTIV